MVGAAFVASGVGLALALDGGNEPPTGAGQDSAAQRRSLAAPPGGPIRLELDQTLRQGQTAAIRIANSGNRAYLYEAFYPACYNLKFFDSAHREFTIPPGTHCDLISRLEVRPGEERTLLSWRLDECVKDNWGCVKSERLPPGIYRLEGTFRRSDGGAVARPMIEFQILKASAEAASQTRVSALDENRNDSLRMGSSSACVASAFPAGGPRDRSLAAIPARNAPSVRRGSGVHEGIVVRARN